jgi:hypothetical protein
MKRATNLLAASLYLVRDWRFDDLEDSFYFRALGR